MHIRHLHRWNLSPREAAEIQRQLAGQVQHGPARGDFSLVAGADVSFEKATRKIYAGVVVCRLTPGDSPGAKWQMVERAGVVTPESFPYVPGLLSFRESPAVLEAFQKLKSEPEVILCDGQGFAHPRRFGLACHLGLLLDRPAIGCAKSRLIGEYREPDPDRGSHTKLCDHDETIGVVLRTRTGIQPVFVSVGHRIDLASAVQVILRCTTRYRLPEPIRHAHAYVNQLRQENQQPNQRPLHQFDTEVRERSSF